MQVQSFETGGFVIHKATVNGVQYSAWFAPNGELVDAERKARNGMYTVSVPRSHTQVREALQRIGRRVRAS